MQNSLLILLITSFIFFACNNDDDTDDNSSNCSAETLISSNLYADAPDDQLSINSLEIIDNCLKINFSASGCDGNSWEVKLIDSTVLLESNPPQRNLRLSLKNEEACLAFINKELTFDISSLKVSGNSVQLNITNTDKDILYQY